MKRDKYFVVKTNNQGKVRIVLHRTVEKEYAYEVYNKTKPTKIFNVELRETIGGTIGFTTIEHK